MKISVYVGTSLDGFIAREDGDFSWLSQFANDEAVAAYNEFTGRIDAIVIGRRTFDEVLKFPIWPYEKPVFVLSSSTKDLTHAAAEKASVLSMTPTRSWSFFLAKASQISTSTVEPSSKPFLEMTSLMS